MKNKSLHGKIAVITGSSRGIGRDIALKYAQEGASLALIALNEDKKLDEVKSEIEAIGVRVITFLGDVASLGFCELAFEKIINHYKRVDILVNCAGTITRAPFEEMSFEEWHRVINVNLHGAFHMCRLFLPEMRKQTYGKIINITSQMAHTPHPSASPSYEVSKSGLTALTRHLASQYAQYNVCINAIAPGSIDTDLPKSMSDEARLKLKSAIPMKRLGEPEEVASCALFLANDMSNYVTGISMHINGGSLIL